MIGGVSGTYFKSALQSGAEAPVADQEKPTPTEIFKPKSEDYATELLPVKSDNMYFLADSVGGSLEAIASNPAIPLLVFTATLMREIQYITRKVGDSEYAIFLTLRQIEPNRPHFLAHDFFMPAQKASASGVSLDAADCQRHFNALSKHEHFKNNGLHRNICHLHSHANMGVFWSSIDDKQQLSREDLGFLDDWRFYCVVNAKDELKCSFVTYKPILSRVDARVAISAAEASHCQILSRHRKAAIDAMIKQALQSAAFTRVSEFEPKTRVQDFDEKWPDWENNQVAGPLSDCQLSRPCAAFSGHAENKTSHPLSLVDFSFLDKQKIHALVSLELTREFMKASGVANTETLRAKKLLSKVFYDVFGDCERCDFKEIEEIAPKETLMDIAATVGESVCEFLLALRDKDYMDYNYESSFLSQEVLNLMRAKNIGAATRDLMDQLSDDVSEIIMNA